MIATGYARLPAAAPSSTPSASTAAPAPAAPTTAASPAAARAPIPVVRNPAPVSVTAPGSAQRTQPVAVSSEQFFKAIDDMDADGTAALISMLTSTADSQPKKFSLE